jgi:hypothetical protein
LQRIRKDNTFKAVFVKIDGKVSLENLEKKLLKAVGIPKEPWNDGNFKKSYFR